jgi:hypothetical protein
MQMHSSELEKKQNQLWADECEVRELTALEKNVLLTEWQRGRRRMLQGRIQKLHNQLRMG